MSTASAFPVTATDQTYNQSNASKLTSYFNRMPPSTSNSLTKPSLSTTAGTTAMYDISVPESDHVYSVVGTTSRRNGGGGLTSVLSRPPTHNSNNEYHYSRYNKWFTFG